ncbi:unnamed protein product [Medioppia subpectinata]|uniref:AXH domain-containing protein n=1 Tax=Medioppia subpectinata TaxID=1979941 RepID=A0A7R9PYW0_9ACAR|nr:unnamed protein product [Medioppia subpectinata]CAG2106449.1 unnamed protein product [Medioppia subpectinata]
MYALSANHSYNAIPLPVTAIHCIHIQLYDYSDYSVSSGAPRLAFIEYSVAITTRLIHPSVVMSNNMCSLDNGKHSMPAIVSSCSPSFNCSPLTSKPFGSHLFGSMSSSLPLHPPSSHTAFPFPPNPLILSGLNFFNPQSSMSWFAHNSLNTPLSLTTNNKDITSNCNDNNNNVNKIDNKYKDSTPALIHPNKDLRSDKNLTESTVTTTATTDISCSTSLSNSMATESERNTTRNHSDINWLTESANMSSRGPSVPSSPSTSGHLGLPLSHQSSHPSQRSLYHTTLNNDMANSQRLYSPRFAASGSPTYFSYPATNSPIGPINAMNGVRPVPSNAHFNGPFVSNFNAYQQFSPTTAQNPISPFLVPNQLSVANTRSQTYPTGIMESSYHQNSHSQNGHNSHNAILSANPCSMAPTSLTTSTSRSPSQHSSDSSSLISSGPYSSPTVSSESAEPQTKSMMRSLESHTDLSARSGANELLNPSMISSGIKRKSPSSPELNANEKNLYKLPFGKEGSRKHRILKPPNISLDSIKADQMTVQSAPLSAPPIPGVRRQDFLKRISDSDIDCYAKDSIADQINCQNMTSFYHQRRKSVPQTSTSSHKPFSATLSAKENSREEREGSHYIVSNENCLPIEEQERQNRLQYPMYFQKGSIIQLGNGEVKRVEDMSTQDFIDSASDSQDLCADCSEVIKIVEKIKSCSVLLSFSVGRDKVPVNVEAPVEHPFFVFHKGWSSCSPERSHIRYGLKCRKLRVGDNCVSLTPRSVSTNPTTHRTSKSPKNSVSDKSLQKKSSCKPVSVGQKSPSRSQSPLSLVKCTAPAVPVTAPIVGSACDANSDHNPKPNELLVNVVESDVSKVMKVSETTDISDSVPMSSSVNEETVKTEDNSGNRRHSASDAIESEPLNAS